MYLIKNFSNKKGALNLTPREIIYEKTISSYQLSLTSN